MCVSSIQRVTNAIVEKMMLLKKQETDGRADLCLSRKQYHFDREKEETAYVIQQRILSTLICNLLACS